MDFSSIERDSAAFTRWRNRAFPFFEDKIFLSHASVIPLPTRVVEAMTAHLQLASRSGQFVDIHREIYDGCRTRAARLIGYGAVADEIAFAGSTSHALGIVATGIEWKSGDNCVVCDGDFPANVVTWKNLAPKYGVEARVVPHHLGEAISVDDLTPFVDSRTRIVSLSSAHFLAGTPLDTRAIGSWLHERNVLFCVDAIQTLGAVSFDAEFVDFICADAHKWLLGPCGIAILWARQGALEQLRPAILGWLATAGRDNWLEYDLTPHPTAERFMPGERSYSTIAGLGGALQLLQEIGSETVAARVTHLRDYSARRLQEIGCKILWQGRADELSGIVTFQPPNCDERGESCAALHEKLERRFALSLRSDQSGVQWIRTSAHFMNCEDDIDELAAMIVAQSR